MTYGYQKETIKQKSFSPKSEAIGGGGSRPWWLVNDFESDAWILKEFLGGEHRSRMKINWSPMTLNSNLINNWDYWKNYGKKLAYWLMESDFGASLKTSSLAVKCREIRALCEWLCFERKAPSVSAITKADVEAFKAYLASLSLKTNTIISKLVLVKSMRTLHELVGEGLAFDPFQSAKSLTRTAKKIGQPNGRTPTIYPEEFFYILNEALAVLRHKDEVLERVNKYVELRSCRKVGKVSRVYRRLTGESSATLISDARLLYGASLVVLFALLGERKHELVNKTIDDVSLLLNSSSKEVHGVVHKTSGTLTGRVTQRAAIDEVRVAFEAIDELTKKTRLTSNSKLFFVSLPFANSANKNSEEALVTRRLYNLLDHFSASIGIDSKLRPHMFRRAFSLLWAWRYEIGDLTLLSQLLYHNDEIFTKHYTEDEDVWRFLPEAEQSLMHEVLAKALMGVREVSGGFGAAIKRYRRMLLSKTTVLSPERVEHFVKLLVERGGYRLVANPDGYCFINAARGHKAKCSTDGVRPNYAHRNEKLCSNCPCFGVDETRVDYWEKRRDAHQRVLDSTSVEMLATAAKEGVARAEKVLLQIKVVQVD